MKITNMMRFILIYGLLFWATLASANTWTIAIDPGHGGKDPGAIGRNLKIYEKNVTLSIAKELKALLDKDPSFRAVLTRNGNCPKIQSQLFGVNSRRLFRSVQFTRRFRVGIVESSRQR